MTVTDSNTTVRQRPGSRLHPGLQDNMHAGRTLQRGWCSWPSAELVEMQATVSASALVLASTAGFDDDVHRTCTPGLHPTQCFQHFNRQQQTS
jgi:hypothetical protein